MIRATGLMIVVGLCLAATLGLRTVYGGDAGVKPQTHCPIMTANPIDKTVYVDYKGWRIYFCCKMCPPTFNKDPDKYVKQLQDEGITLAKAPVPQTKCPITGKTIDRKHYVDAKGYRIYLCCPHCAAKVKADPDAALKKIEENGEAPEPLPASHTPKHEHHDEG